MNVTRLKRIGLGILASIATLGIFDLLPSFTPSSLINYQIFGRFFFWLAVEGAVAMFVAALAGAYVAKVNFAGPAILLAISVWILAIYISNSIASAAGQNDLVAIVSTNMLGILFGVVGAGLGAIVGRRFAGEKTEENVVGAT